MFGARTQRRRAARALVILLPNMLRKSPARTETSRLSRFQGERQTQPERTRAAASFTQTLQGKKPHRWTNRANQRKTKLMERREIQKYQFETSHVKINRIGWMKNSCGCVQGRWNLEHLSAFNWFICQQTHLKWTDSHTGQLLFGRPPDLLCGQFISPPLKDILSAPPEDTSYEKKPAWPWKSPSLSLSLALYSLLQGQMSRLRDACQALPSCFFSAELLFCHTGRILMMSRR